MSAFLGHLQTITTFALSVLLILFFFSHISITNLSLDQGFVIFLAMAKLKRGIGVMILSLIVFISPAMLSFGNIAPLLSSLTFLPLYLPSLSQIFFQMRHIFLVATLDPFVAALDSPVDFSVQPLDILNPFPSSSFNEQVEDEQVKDELPNPELGSPTPTPLEDLAQDIPPHHSTRVKSIPTYLLDYHCYIALATLHEPHTYREVSTDPLWQIAMKEELDALSKNHT